VRAAALRDYHGDDRLGKDGPLAKAGMALLTLYHTYRAHQATSPNEPFEAPGLVRVIDGRVVVDAVAAGDPEALRADLERLGARRLAVARRLVSGRLPIAAIPDAARLASLQSLRPAMGVTQGAPRRQRALPRNPTAADSAALDSSTAGSATADSSAAAAEEAEAVARRREGADDGGGSVRLVAIGVTVVVALGLTALFLRNL
jgi:hypothetical protein